MPASVVEQQQDENNRLLTVYMTSMRQRFKNEVNRLTSGAMLDMLKHEADAQALVFPLTYLYAYHWLRHNVPDIYQEKVLDTFRGPKFAFLMKLLMAENARTFITGYIEHWVNFSGEGPVQQQQLLHLLAQHENKTDSLVDSIENIWNRLGLFTRSYKVIYQDLARQERDRYASMLGAEDEERLALVDAIPDSCEQTATPRFNKLGLIPAMGCPQTCRHCMFIWRPPKSRNSDPELLYSLVDSMTDNVLFTGGDLTNHLDSFYAAISKMPNISTFAILLNGDFADDLDTTRQVLERMANAIRSRAKKLAKARVLLQISFDEFHQEVYVDKHGKLQERIPVSKIANIVELTVQFPKEIQLALLHKQTSLNFSMDVIYKGVFARLTEELGRRGYQLEVLSASPSARLKRNPQAPAVPAQLLKDASFILTKFPDVPILLTSSTIDGYGRAESLDESETVMEKDLLQQVLTTGKVEGESFDIDMMFWFNGWVTLFNAVHMCLGNLHSDGPEKILARQRKDPLSHAMHNFDRRLLDYYAEVRHDLSGRIEMATGPHHLFHMLTEDADVRLHMTRRLLDS